MDCPNWQQSGEHPQLPHLEAGGLLQAESNVLRILLCGADRLATIQFDKQQLLDRTQIHCRTPTAFFFALLDVI